MKLHWKSWIKKPSYFVCNEFFNVWLKQDPRVTIHIRGCWSVRMVIVAHFANFILLERLVCDWLSDSEDRLGSGGEFLFLCVRVGSARAFRSTFLFVLLMTHSKRINNQKTKTQHEKKNSLCRKTEPKKTKKINKEIEEEKLFHRLNELLATETPKYISKRNVNESRRA